MKRNYYFISFFLIFNLYSTSFLAQHIDAGPDQTLCMNENQVHLNALSGYATTSRYVVNAIPFTWDNDFSTANDVMITKNGNTELFREDDTYSDAIALPFDFYFFGKKYDHIIVGANGDLVFQPALAQIRDEWYLTQDLQIPDHKLPYWNDADQISYASIMGVYQDLDISVPNSDLALKYKTTGTAPNRQFKIIYQNVAQYDCTNQLSSQMIVLNEADYSIEIHVKNKPVCATWNGGLATLGIQNDALLPDTCGNFPGDNTSTGLPNRNTGVWEVLETQPEAYKFTPDGLVSLAWYDENHQLLGQTGNIDAVVNDIATFTLEGSFIDCHGNLIQESDQVTVTKLPALQLDLPAQAYICENEAIYLDAQIKNTNDYNQITYTWLNDQGQTISSDSKVVVNMPGTYKVIITTDNCQNEFEVLVETYPSPCKVPQGISPNGDGKNDKWVLDYLADQIGIDKVEIFDRRGVKVYEKNNYIDQFVGKNDNGTDLPTAGYFYVIHLKDNRTLTGWLIIAR